MSDKKRTKIGNTLSKVLARIDTSTKKGSLQEAILKGDFFTDDFEKEFEPSEPSSPKKRGRGRPRKNPIVEPTNRSSRVPGVFRVGKTLKTRVQIEGIRVQVDLKTNKWEVARTRKGKIDGMLFDGKFFGKCPPISLKNAWEQFKATQVGQVEESTFNIYVSQIERIVLPLLGNMPLDDMDNQKVALLLNDYQGIHPLRTGTTTPDTSHLETIAKLYAYTPDGGTPWNASIRGLHWVIWTSVTDPRIRTSRAE